MKILVVIALIIPALCAADNLDQELSYVGSIICFSDSISGTKMAEAAARFLTSEGQEGYYSTVFVVSSMEDTYSDRFLILILSADGEKQFRNSSALFEKVLRILMERMKRHFGDNKVSVVLQQQDKTNIIEAQFGENNEIEVNILEKTVKQAAPIATVSPILNDPTFELP